MAYITDTHSLLWYFVRPDRLERLATEIFEQITAGDENLIIPVIVLAELLFVIERRQLNVNFNETLQQLQEIPNVQIADLTLETVQSLQELGEISEMHDRLIVAEAIKADAILITKDQEITKSGLVRTIW